MKLKLTINLDDPCFKLNGETNHLFVLHAINKACMMILDETPPIKRTLSGDKIGSVGEVELIKD